MPAQNSQPTVLVKKSDGSFARMTLDEVNKMRGVPRDGIKIPASAGMTVKNGIAASPSAPRNDSATVDSRFRGNDSKIDNRNDNKPAPAPLPIQQSSRVDEIIGKLSFKVPAEYINRLRSLVQLRIKGVRDDRQTKETAMRALKDGGLGLDETQADELIKKCILLVGIASSPPKAAPRNDNIKNGIAASIPADRRVAPRNDSILSRPTATTGHPFMSANHKPAVQDIMVKPAQMSPVDEIKYFTLTDFRRLSSVPAEAANRLRQKFINLKEESFLLFLEAMEKWRQSPLFATYMAMVEGALSNRAKLPPSGDKETIQLPEIYAIIEMEKLLS